MLPFQIFFAAETLDKMHFCRYYYMQMFKNMQEVKFMNNEIIDKMNVQEKEILCYLMRRPFENQRQLADAVGYSLGIVNRSLKKLMQEGFLTEDLTLTGEAGQMMEQHHPKRAVILAAGTGMRMVPINMEAKIGRAHV